MACETVSVRLVEWNVAMSLQSKTHLLASLNPAIAILPESAHPDKTQAALEAIGATSMRWIGANPNKGLLAVAFGGWRLELDDSYDPGFQWVMPLHLTGLRSIRILAVWDMNHRGKGYESARKLGACRASLGNYESFLSGEADLTLISGDFNNSVYWDKPSKAAKFGDFMDQVEARGFVSAYHSHHGCARGAEQHPTLWWMKNLNTTYHIDYTFVSRPDSVTAVALGTHSEWVAHSDHSPMTVDLQVWRSAIAPSDEPPTQLIAAEHDENPHTKTPREVEAKSRAVKEIGRKIGQVRFSIEPGALPDMLCGVNGVGFQQSLRPSYFTAEWRNGTLVEVRIWGPHVLKDDRVGVRLLDHVWHNVNGSGPVKLTDLPPLVAGQLRTYAAEKGMPLPGE